jgi:tripartite-type tricarboxylate transporter receptor subunit TctC
VRFILTCLLGLLLSVSAHAQPYPSRSIRIVVPYPPGGIVDLTGRLIAEGLQQKFGQPVVVENKAGGNGSIGMREVIGSQPDGYTLVVGVQGGLIFSNALEKSPPYDPLRDLTPIGGTPEYASVVLVNKDMPVNSIKDFVEHAKKQPGKLTYASTGTGSFEYIGLELLQKQAGISLVQVPYRGGMLALADVMSGRVDIWAPAFPGVREQVRAGTLKALAVTSPYRLPGLPDVPTMVEAGFDIKSTGWLGLYGPAKLPNEIRSVLEAALIEMMKTPDTQAKLRTIGFEPTVRTAKELSDLQAAEMARWIEFFTEVGLRK